MYRGNDETAPLKPRDRHVNIDGINGPLTLGAFGIDGCIGEQTHSQSLEKPLEHIRIQRVLVRALDGNLAARDQFRERTVHVYHALSGTGLDDRVYFMRPLLADEIRDRLVVNEELIRRNEAAGDARNKALAEDAGHGSRELESYLILLRCGECVDDAVDGLRGIVRMKRREYEVSGLRGCDCGSHRLRSAHLADENDVNVLAEGRLERSREIFRVDAHFTLVYERLLRLIDILHRVLDGHDMFHPLDVDEFYESGKRRGLSLPYRPDHQEESLGFAGEAGKDVRQIQFLNRTNSLWY